jgi:Zn-dependent protease with chaperone function
MADAAFYDGESARRRTVSLRVTESSLHIHEGGDWIASWPTGAVRRKDAPEGTLRLTLAGGPELARLDVTDPEDQSAILAHCLHLKAKDGERTGRIVFWSAAAVASILFSVFFLLPIMAERLTPLIPISVERRLGDAVDNQVRLAFSDKICSHPAGVAALDTLVSRLKSTAKLEIEPEIAVLDSSIPNAVALPGGKIYLFRKLLDRAHSADEIAGVLAHEIGHVAHRDSMRMLIQSSGTSFLLGLLFGDVTGSGAVIMASRHLLESAYSREAETAADDYAAHTMLALGRAPGPLGQLLQRIVGSSGDLPALLSTHPLTDQRLKALERLVPARPGPPLLTEEEWRSLKEICKTT